MLTLKADVCYLDEKLCFTFAADNIFMSFLSKMRVKQDEPLWLLSCPPECASLFDVEEIKTKLSGKEQPKQLVFFAMDKAELDKTFPKIAKHLAEDAVCWIAYPKKSSGIKSDLVRDEGWGIIDESGYQLVTSVSVNENWTGMRVRKPDPNAVYKRTVPMEERKTEGVDYVNRTVTIPPDAMKAMKPYKGLDTFFHSMAFSHKREYIEAIADAKKPETRQRRIEKMVEMVLKIREEKELKKKK